MEDERLANEVERETGFEPTTPGSKVRDPSAELEIEARQPAYKAEDRPSATLALHAL